VAYQSFRVLAWLFLVGAVLQFFLAGLGVFRAASFSPHATVGTLLGITSLILLILAVFSVLMGTLSPSWFSNGFWWKCSWGQSQP
jgi:multisubunit Na+/H+ antiporter MnhG subunit